MRLLTDTGGDVPQLEEFISDNIPAYAILSHTWEDDEVSLQDLGNATKCVNQKGFQKIKETCNLAALNSFKYTWIDTCCIDKQSSAELSEAINSMFYWYQKADVCYVYLSDLTPEDAERDLESALRRCRWCTRGWTLQELIAPAQVQFYDCNWTYIGDKATLSEMISSITGIPVALLGHEKQPSDFSVACRMSWLSKRQTTRVEDMAYCMLGIFDVNMPLIYGEREKAFFRLQQEVLQVTGDLSILAWTDEQTANREYSGFLAESPSQFARSFLIQTNPDISASRSLRVTPLEIEMQVALMRFRDYDKARHFSLLPLFSTIGNSAIGNSAIGISIRKHSGSQYVRWKPDHLMELQPSADHPSLQKYWVMPRNGTTSIIEPAKYGFDRHPMRSIFLPPRLPRDLVDKNIIPGFKLIQGDRAVRLVLGKEAKKIFRLSSTDMAPLSHWDEGNRAFFCMDSGVAVQLSWAAWFLNVEKIEVPEIPMGVLSGFSILVICFYWHVEPCRTNIVVSRDLSIAHLIKHNLKKIKFEDGMEAWALVKHATEAVYPVGEDITVGTTEETEVIIRCVSQKDVLPEMCPNPVLTLVFEGEVRERARKHAAEPTDSCNVH